MLKGKNLFYTILAVCGLIVIAVSLFVYINKNVPSDISTIQPEDSSKTGLALYPDLPLVSVPKEAVSVKFVLEYRSALNGKLIKVRGVIIDTILGEKACPPDRGMCAQSRIFLADNVGENRDKLYDLTVIVKEETQEKDYPIGKEIEVEGIVDGSKDAVTIYL